MSKRERILERLIFAATVLLAAAPMGMVAWHLFGTHLSAYLPLYPLAALLLFRRPGDSASGTIGTPFPLIPCFQSFPLRRLTPILLLLPGSAFIAAGVILGRTSLLWIGSYWNTLAVAALHGVVFAFPAPLLIFAAPPLASFLSIVAGFSLRIWLSGQAARLLAFIDGNSRALGNIVTFRGDSFSVDRVCEGMKMAVASFLIAAVLARFSSKNGRWLIALGIVPLWLGANLFRITALILFPLPPGSSGHELVGLAIFAGMILFPLLVISLAFPAEHRPGHRIEASKRPSSRKQVFILLLVTALLLLSLRAPRRPESPAIWPQAVLEYSRTTVPDPAVAIFQKGNDSLILKRNLFAPGTAHDPRICFEAAGFSFRDETEEIIDGFRVRTARLEKAGKAARLLWWYEWEDSRSSSDIEWRIARIQGQDVLQVNLYGPNHGNLRTTARLLLREKGLLPPGPGQGRPSNTRERSRSSPINVRGIRSSRE